MTKSLKRAKLINREFCPFSCLYISCYECILLRRISCLRLALALHILLKEHVLAVEHGVGELRDPVAENHHACLLREEKVELYVSVSEHEVVDIVVCLHVLLRKEHEVLAVLTHVRRFLAVGTLQTRVLRPGESEPHSPAWVQRVEQHLARAVVEYALYELEAAVGVAQSVAVRYVEHLVVDLYRLGLGVHDKATLLFEVAVGPDVVVAGEVVHLHAHVGQFRELAQKARVALRHNVAPLAPEVEHIAQQIDGACLCLYRVEKPHESTLLSATVVDGPRPEVGIAKEIYIFHANSKLDNS